jgi:hypothetical protein
MSKEKKEVNGQFKYEQDRKRYHRYRIESTEGIVGTLYVSKDEPVPDNVILTHMK